MSCENKLPGVFGSNVFNDKVMRERLPKETYKALRKTIEKGTPLTPEVASVVANAMKDWALEKGASHFTHWFQPLTGITAEKHDSFIDPDMKGGITLELTGNMLIQGEPDASSFPSGGLRATFEARGYTAWDCTSPAFLKEDAAGDLTLCIPTAFMSYTGESLDKKTPLLRSMEAVSKQAVRLLRVLGNKTVTRVTATVGPEQEYFLIDKKFYDQRMDLALSGRTLFGAASPKGQELEDQYFGSIKDRIAKFMKELDIELWKMGVSAKTKHNEVAPAQFEIAVVFSTTNIAVDHNQLVMESLQKIALRNGLVCLLHEKPFAGVNGSGKHNNWSLATAEGENLLEPGKTPHDNLQFLVVLAAIIKAVDKHAGKLRAAAANTGNDLRLGANEAPPAIISVFMGTGLTDILTAIAAGKKAQSTDYGYLHMGVDSLPPLPLHNTDRNRTSPFAFTGNKFEFRMVPSSASVAGPNTILNTITAEAFDEVATRLEKAGKGDLNKEAEKIVREYIKAHGRVIFNGNGYSQEWVKEAKKRGLPNISSTVDALDEMNTPEAHKLFEKYKVLSKAELHSRHEIYLESYVKQIGIEAKCAIRMLKTLYIPAVICYTGSLANTINSLKGTGASSAVQKELLITITGHLESAKEKLEKLEAVLEKSSNISDISDKARAYRDKVKVAMDDARADIDALEVLVCAEAWPVPTYADMLFKL
ncbi:MAG TPA: glutamine synthetase III [Candidatus Omnitrophota bacterium]|nr:glutamine synthetase type III [Candidatus Omnitrophota bacterium]HRK61278.1 glutamine synthetase III [Candidatus Omnitrophota bacterium]